MTLWYDIGCDLDHEFGLNDSFYIELSIVTQMQQKMVIYEKEIVNKSHTHTHPYTNDNTNDNIDLWFDWLRPSDTYMCQ